MDKYKKYKILPVEPIVPIHYGNTELPCNTCADAEGDLFIKLDDNCIRCGNGIYIILSSKAVNSIHSRFTISERLCPSCNSIMDHIIFKLDRTNNFLITNKKEKIKT